MTKRSVFSPLSKLILGQEKNWHQLHHQSEAEISKCSRVFLLLGMHFSWWNFFIEFLCFNVPVQRYPRALRWGWNLGARPNRHLPNTEPSSRVNKTCVKSWIFMAQSSPIESLIVCQGANLLFMVEIPWVVPNNDDNARDWLTLAQAPSDTDIILIKWLAGMSQLQPGGDSKC